MGGGGVKRRKPSSFNLHPRCFVQTLMEVYNWILMFQHLKRHLVSLNVRYIQGESFVESKRGGEREKFQGMMFRNLKHFAVSRLENVS